MIVIRSPKDDELARVMLGTDRLVGRGRNEFRFRLNFQIARKTCLKNTRFVETQCALLKKFLTAFEKNRLEKLERAKTKPTEFFSVNESTRPIE